MVFTYEELTYLISGLECLRHKVLADVKGLQDMDAKDELKRIQDVENKVIDMEYDLQQKEWRDKRLAYYRP